jgi:hypothetical protein
MIRITELKLPLDHDELALPALIVKTLGIASEELASHSVYKRSYDARKKKLLLVYICDVEVAPTLVASRTALPPEGANFPRGGPSENCPTLEATLLKQFEAHPHIRPAPDQHYYPVVQLHAAPALRPVVVGFGPCGIFAALLLAQMGFKPIVLERGKKVRERTKDTWGLWRKSSLNPESNVQFGEGGAGTFSDGKLWSQIKDPRHLGRKVMMEFVKAGAPEEILLVSKPHIGTFKLVKVVEHMREQIIALGGEVRFEQRVSDVQIENGQIRGLTVQNLSHDAKSDTHYELRADHVVLALGHSSRDTVAMLHQRGVYMDAKPFSIGFRIEHPQGVIDRARLGQHAGHPLLGAADYKLVHHANNGQGKGRSVYSFCMCPGGTVVAATSEPGRVVTNGMSQYSRNERNANAGIVVGISPADYPGGPLAGIEFQRQLETHAYTLGGSNYQAPGQLVGDFIAGKPSTQLGSVAPSYKPGVLLGDLHSALPAYAIAAIREALPVFGKKIPGFDMHDAVLTGVETRTSSPVKMTRGDDFQSLNVKGLYPAGEGASYAGGILSAGVDGIEVAEAVALSITRPR